MAVSRNAPDTSLLVQALAGQGSWSPRTQPKEIVEQVLYHGVVGELALSSSGWRPEVIEPLRRAAVSQGMWEIRHRQVLQGLLAAFTAAGIRVLLLKGSAIAYDLYPEPAHRSRGDSDLLIQRADLVAARAILEEQGFSPFFEDSSGVEPTAMEQHWSRKTPDGLRHEIDLHWQAMNAVALSDFIPFEIAWKRALPLPRLSPDAFGLPRDLALLLACAHRAQHILSAYFVEGRTYYGGDRLIWVRDIDLLARALDAEGWAAFETAVLKAGLAGVALHGLEAAVQFLSTPVPEQTVARLRAAPQGGLADQYLLAGHQAGRVWRDFIAVGGLRNRIAFLRSRFLPNAAFMRSKYPDLAHRPLLHLHVRRIAEFLIPRGRAGDDKR